MITDKDLLIERTNPIGGIQRVYRFPSGYGLSLINSPMAHGYPFAWEAAVLQNVDDKGNGSITYGTKLTDEVEVFETDKETNAFIKKAKKVLGSLPKEEPDEQP